MAVGRIATATANRNALTGSVAKSPGGARPGLQAAARRRLQIFLTESNCVLTAWKQSVDPNANWTPWTAF